MTNTIRCADCLDALKRLPDRSVDLVFGSPPYALKGNRYIGGQRRKLDVGEWIDWMLEVTHQAVRVSRGYVLWVANGAVRSGHYQPAVEGLIYQAWRAGLIVERPCVWHKNAPPNRRDWFGNDWEFVAAFKSCPRPWFDPAAVAAPPKYTHGGHFRQRSSNGQRRRGGDYPTRQLAHPRDVVRVLIGGGHMGHPAAHENEAPFPLKLADYFVRTCCPPGGIVLDPFGGSGTTAHAALLAGRSFRLVEVRSDQVQLARARLAQVARDLRKQTGSTP